MIIREQAESISLITQHDHARISGAFATAWKETYFLGKSFRKSVELAITEHDRGWIPLDTKPFLNDQTNLPYSFIDFPLLPKLIFYKHGLDEIEAIDKYAALLCSEHYTNFVKRSSNESAKQFVRDEGRRQEKIKLDLPIYNEADFRFHLQLLQFCDQLSLYVCLNEPQTNRADTHYFFKNGLAHPCLENKSIELDWVKQDEILMSELPFKNNLTIELSERIVPKKLLEEVGLVAAYEQTLPTISKIRFTT